VRPPLALSAEQPSAGQLATGEWLAALMSDGTEQTVSVRGSATCSCTWFALREPVFRCSLVLKMKSEMAIGKLSDHTIFVGDGVSGLGGEWLETNGERGGVGELLENSGKNELSFPTSSRTSPTFRVAKCGRSKFA